jgi:hypothetical protein
MTDDLIKRLRMLSPVTHPGSHEAADALETQEKRIAELDAEIKDINAGWSASIAQAMDNGAAANKAEADLAAAQADIADLLDWVEDLGGDSSAWKAAARGEQPKSDVCPTCKDRDWINSRLGDCPRCGGTGKPEPVLREAWLLLEKDGDVLQYFTEGEANTDADGETVEVRRITWMSDGSPVPSVMPSYQELLKKVIDERDNLKAEIARMRPVVDAAMVDDVCPTCNGSGEHPSANSLWTCPDCNGTGKKETER